MFTPQAQPHAQSLFLFPIVFGINSPFYADLCGGLSFYSNPSFDHFLFWWRQCQVLRLRGRKLVSSCKENIIFTDRRGGSFDRERSTSFTDDFEHEQDNPRTWKATSEQPFYDQIRRQQQPSSLWQTLALSSAGNSLPQLNVDTLRRTPKTSWLSRASSTTPTTQYASTTSSSLLSRLRCQSALALFNRYLPKFIFHSPSSYLCTVMDTYCPTTRCSSSLFVPLRWDKNTPAPASSPRRMSTRSRSSHSLPRRERIAPRHVPPSWSALLRDFFSAMTRVTLQTATTFFPAPAICALQVSYPRERHLVSSRALLSRKTSDFPRVEGQVRDRQRMQRQHTVHCAANAFAWAQGKLFCLKNVAASRSLR